MRISVKAPVTVPIDFELDTMAIAAEMAFSLQEYRRGQPSPKVLKEELERAIRLLGPRALCPTISETRT